MLSTLLNPSRLLASGHALGLAVLVHVADGRKRGLASQHVGSMVLSFMTAEPLTMSELCGEAPVAGFYASMAAPAISCQRMDSRLISVPKRSFTFGRT